MTAEQRMEQLDRLWNSSTDLMERFKANPSIKQALDRMMSEVVELVVATNDPYGTSNDEIAKEAADVCVTLINVLRACGIEKDQFAKAIDSVIIKNGLKNDTTHQRSAQQGVERKSSDLAAIPDNDFAQLQALQEARRQMGGG